MPGVRRSRALGLVIVATVIAGPLWVSRATAHLIDETTAPSSLGRRTPTLPDPEDPPPPPEPEPAPPPVPAGVPEPPPAANPWGTPLPSLAALAQVSVGQRQEGAWYDHPFWGGPPSGTALYTRTVAELGFTSNLAPVGGARGAVGLHYAQRVRYRAGVGAGFGLAIDGYARVLGGDAQGYAARLVWSLARGRGEWPILLDVGFSSALLDYRNEARKGGVIGLAVGAMVPLGRWAHLDGKVNVYLGGDRNAELSLVGDLTNRFYLGGGASYWFETFGAQFFGGLRL